MCVCYSQSSELVNPMDYTTLGLRYIYAGLGSSVG